MDERGQTVRDENALGDYTAPGYDNNGNRVTWQDRRGKLWQFTCDREDRLTATTSPLSRTTAQGCVSPMLSSAKRSTRGPSRSVVAPGIAAPPSFWPMHPPPTRTRWLIIFVRQATRAP